MLHPAPRATLIPSSPTVASAPHEPVATPTNTAPAPTPAVTAQAKATVLPTLTAGLIRLRDDLDDPLGYCIDVRGFGSGIRLDADLQAHSCKRNSPDDQSFTLSRLRSPGLVLLVEYDVCLAVADPKEGASILLHQCDNPSVAREFRWMDDGKLRFVADSTAPPSDLCVGVAGGPGEPAGGRNHLRRDLMLVDCDATDPNLVTWDFEKNRGE